MKLALDHHYSPVIALRLRGVGHDAVAAVERGWDREEDEPLLVICREERRALLTNDVADFTAIWRGWVPDGRSHSGLIFTSDASLARSRHTIGRFVERLSELFVRYPDQDGLRDRVLWL